MPEEIVQNKILEQKLSHLLEKGAELPTTQILDEILRTAYLAEASDVHFEPSGENFRIRFRIDGILQEIIQLPLNIYSKIVSRIKFLSKMKLDVQGPQEGRFSQKFQEEEVDFRVSTLPGQEGEILEMRLLRSGAHFLKLEQLGFNQNALNLIKEAISKPSGIIFNTGPTGSGKTTTLYAVLEKLNQPAKKIITLEDPIEYELPGVDQSQIDPAKGYDFAKGLRAALRQDPDILMVGEVRDSQTAEIALNAAVTGHLVLTTLHVNSSAAAYPRLLDMGVQPYLLAGSINIIIAQRLVRVVHKDCGGKGCEGCHNTGFKGRTAIVEVLKPNLEIEKLVQRKASVSDFERLAKEQGMRTMSEDGLEKVKKGITTKEELERIIGAGG